MIVYTHTHTHTHTPRVQICTNGSLIVDFTLEEKPRIISWYFCIKDHVEFVPRSCLSQIQVSVNCQII